MPKETEQPTAPPTPAEVKAMQDLARETSPMCLNLLESEEAEDE